MILVASIHHVCMDGVAITKVLETFARACRIAQAHDGASENLGPTLDSDVLDRSRLFQSSNAADITKLRAYMIHSDMLTLGHSGLLTQTFRFYPRALKFLKQSASPSAPSGSWITTHDAVCALCWRVQSRVRQRAHLLQSDATMTFGLPVAFRALMKPPLHPDYMGNAFLMAKSELPLRSLLSPDGLSVAAAKIRETVAEVDAGYVENMVAVAKSLKNKRSLQMNILLDLPRTGCTVTTYQKFPHSTMDWGPALGTYEAFRMPHGAFTDGFPVILPTLADGSWEVAITLDEKIMGLFENDDEWQEYTVPE